ncbi:multidrug efflux pump subunit AcrA (membrane-fusion protein) [Elusimicrobium simillimum]|uniref:efflux RND transporter periplasmic adaptor subunit n=1 Tax=Elusimicrobium simillimum TaxID=3143438 RepID=UPI003C6FC95D
MKKILIIGSIIVVAGIIFFATRNSSKEVSSVEKDRFTVVLEQVQKRNLKNELLISGSIKALEEATLFPRVEGKLLRNVLKEGSAVKRGETVSLIERDEVGAVYEAAAVPSTITGVVGRVYLDSGANVTRNTAIAFIVNQTKVRVLLDIPERYIGKIYKGQSASFTVESLENERFEGKINIISPVVDTASRSVLVELLADNPKGMLKSGMFAKVDIVLDEKKDALSIQKSSVYTDDSGKTYVFVPVNDFAMRKDVETGFQNGEYLEIKKGIKEGDDIITFVFGIKDGSKITVSK